MDPAIIFADADELSHAVSSTRHLPELQRLVVRLSYGLACEHGRPCAPSDIAAVLMVPEKKVGELLRDGLQTLRFRMAASH